MCFVRIRALLARADALRSDESKSLLAKSRDDRIRISLRWRESILVEAFESVPFERVVTGSDAHAAIEFEFADHHADGRGHRDAEIHNLASHRHERALHSIGERFAASTTIAPDCESWSTRVLHQLRSKRGSKFARNNRRHRRADDAARAGDREHEWSVRGVHRHGSEKGSGSRWRLIRS